MRCSELGFIDRETKQRRLYSSFIGLGWTSEVVVFRALLRNIIVLCMTLGLLKPPHLLYS